MVTSQIVTASAGSGKTHRLTERIFELLQQNARFMLAITFTRAATAEMSRRILERIDQATLTVIDKLGLFAKTQSIGFSTFDSLFFRLLSGQEEPVRVMDEKAALLIEEMIGDAFFEAIGKTGDLQALFVATRLLNSSLEHLASTLDANDRGRFDRNDLTQGGLDRFGREIVIVKAQISELQRQLVALDHENLATRVSKNVIGSLSGDVAKLADKRALGRPDLASWQWLGRRIDWSAPPYSEINRVFLQLQSRVAEFLLLRAWLREATLTQMFRLHDDVARVVKERSGELFFGDILQRLVELDGGVEASSRPVLMERYFEHGLHRLDDLLIDEFQDTSRDNLAILMPLMDEVLSEVDSHGQGRRSVFAVGDWKQMIYAWRGADRDAAEAVLERYRGGQLQEDSLRHNWRSTPLLISFFNRLVSIIFSGRERDEHQVTPPPADRQYSGISEVALVRVAARQSKLPIYERVVELLKAKRAEWDCAYSDIAVLFRSHRDKDQTAQRLAMEGIGFSEVKGRQLLSTEEGVAVFLLLTHLFGGDSEHSFAVRGIRASAYAEALMRIVESRETIVASYAEPWGLKAVCDVLEICRGAVPDSCLDVLFDEAVNFFSDDGIDAAGFLAYLFRVREKVTVPEPPRSDRVKLATIHGTKGLQFRHVVVVWLETSHPTLFYLDEIRSHVSFNQSEMALWTGYESEQAQRIVQAHDAAAGRAAAEQANLLYVAATRATHTLTVVVKEPARSELSAGVAGVIDQSDFGCEKLVQNDALWHRIDYGAPLSAEESEVTILDPPTHLPRGADLLAEVDNILMSEDILSGLRRGDRIHAYFAGVKQQADRPTQHDLIGEELQTVQGFLSDPAVIEIMFRPGRVYTEQAVSDTHAFGIIDRIIDDGTTVTITELKTGVPGQLMGKYRSQLARYRKIVETLYPERAVEAYLLLIDVAGPGRVVACS